ncbi:MAG: DUF561 domain-containing protein, partial [Symploca sp. SIO3E6]|nr:DUF561 domain-containing protein [Caldora sp. SIO3E6]
MINLFNGKLLNSFANKTAIKVICGLEEMNIMQIIKLVKAAELSGATYLDIAANTRIITIVKSLTNLPICVSSIDPLELYNSVLVGADIVEIGNFDIFYKRYMNFSVDCILKLAEKTRTLIVDKDICVTIPHLLSLS